jgi:hypothetical protein
MPSKNGIFLFLLLPLLFQGLGGFLLFQQEQRTAHAAFKHRQYEPRAPKIHLQFSPAELARVRVKKNEIRLQGQMYDIVSMEESGGLVHLWVIPDEKESRVLEKIARLLGRPEKSAGQPRSAAGYWLFAPFEVPESPCLRVLSSPWAIVRNFQHPVPGPQCRPDTLFPPPQTEAFAPFSV